MAQITYILLFVADPARSAAFYSRVLDRKPVEQSPTFALFVQDNGVKIGLWKADGVEPPVTGAPGAGEVAIALDSRAAVDAAHAVWRERGVTIAQAPCAMDFGYTFLALDPDGHRLRVLVLEGV